MHKALRIILIILAVLLVLGGAAALFVSAKLNRISYDAPEPAAEHAGQSSEIPENEKENKQDNKVITLLLVGSDNRIPFKDDIGRGDCEIICRLNPKLGTVRLVSIERAVGVPVQSRDGGYDLINHAYRYDGGAVLSQTVGELFHLDFDGYVNVDYEAFEAIVNAIGGVDIELTEIEADALNGQRLTNAHTQTFVHKGFNHLDGYDALQYCRLRYTDSDLVRVQRQRKCIEACMKQVKDLSLIERSNMADEVLPFVNTNLSKAELTKLLLMSPKFLKNIDIEGITIPENNDYTYRPRWDHDSCWAIDFEKYEKVIKDFIK